MKILRKSWFVGRWCAGCLRDILLIGVWTLLAVLLVAQIYVSTSEQLTMPGWLLRKFEERLDAAGLQAQIASATVDPAGRVSINGLRLAPPSFDTPLITVEQLHLRLDPWALAAGRFESRELRASGVDFWLPAMLSPSGQSEPVIGDISLAFKPERNRLGLDRLSGRMANLTFNIRGALDLPPGLLSGRTADRSQLVGLIVRHYLRVCRQLAGFESRLAPLDSPHLDLTLTPSATEFATVSAIATSRGADLDLTPYDPRAGRVQLTNLRAATEFSLRNTRASAAQVSLRCALARSSLGAELLNLRGVLNLTVGQDFTAVKPQELALTCDSVHLARFAADHLSLHLTPGPSPRLDADVMAHALDADWHLRLTADPKQGEGSGTIEGAITPWIVQLIADKTGIAARRLLRLAGPTTIAADIGFADGWKLREARGRLSSGSLVAYGAPLDSTKGAFTFDGRNLVIDDIVLRQGENLAFGSYSMDTASRDFRFLLNGKLRPMVIAPLFASWWTNFWQNFDFTGGVPQADVDIGGRWGIPRSTTVFVHADIAHPVIRAVPFDRARATMFIRPEFYDALEFVVDRGGRSARGTFTRTIDLTRDHDSLRAMDFDVTTDLDLTQTARVFGSVGDEVVAPFAFAEPPLLRLAGHVTGAASPAGSHRDIALDLRSTGPFALFGFPLSDLNFRGVVRDENIDLDHVQAGFAQGQAQGRIHLSGADDVRRLRFNVSLNQASIGETIRTLEEYSAKIKGLPVPEQSRFQQRVSEGILNAHLAAEGLYRDPFSYRGQGNLELTGAQLGEIKLLGALSTVLSKSSLFSFTSLQLTAARSTFTLDGPRLDLPDLKITGQSAIIETKGTYLLDRKTMEFNAKVYPFSQAKTLFANAVGFVLVPLSNVLELKLTGPLDQPDWRFAYGPSSFLHTLASSKYDPAAPAPPPAELRKRPPPFLQR